MSYRKLETHVEARWYRTPKSEGDWISASDYGRIFCYHWEQRMATDWALARHMQQQLPPRQSNTYRGKRRNSKRSMAWAMRKTLGCPPHIDLP